MRFAGKVWRLLVGIKDGLVLVFMLLFFSALFAVLTARPSPASVRDGALLLALDGAIVEERTEVDPFAALLSGQAPMGEYQARDLVHALDKAAEDDRIDAIVLDLDRFVGGVMAELKEQNVADNTFVLFISDNGRPFPRDKTTLYDSGIKTPFIVHWPGHVGAGSRCNSLLSSVDIAPAFLELAGLSTPKVFEGSSFLPLLRNPQQGIREFVFAERNWHDYEDRVRAVRNRRFKYIRNFRPEDPGTQRLAFRDRLDLMAELWALREAGKLTGPQALWFESPRQEEELYDLRSDPDEVRNLADDPAHAATLGRLRADLDAWLLAYPDLGAVPEAELIERFWPGGVQPVTAAPTFEVEAGGTGARRLRLRSASHGASIGYRRNGAGSVSEWDLFTEPFEVLPGDRIVAIDGAPIASSVPLER